MRAYCIRDRKIDIDRYSDLQKALIEVEVYAPYYKNNSWKPVCHTFRFEYW